MIKSVIRIVLPCLMSLTVLASVSSINAFATEQNGLDIQDIIDIFTGDDDPTDPEPYTEPTEPEPTDPEPTDPEPTQPEPTDPEPTEPLTYTIVEVVDSHYIPPNTYELCYRTTFSNGLIIDCWKEVSREEYEREVGG